MEGWLEGVSEAFRAPIEVQCEEIRLLTGVYRTRWMSASSRQSSGA